MKKGKSPLQSADKTLLQAIKESSHIEGINFGRAQRNSKMIAKLKKYGRAFSV